MGYNDHACCGIGTIPTENGQITPTTGAFVMSILTSINYA